MLSVEAMGDATEMRGKDAARGKGERWSAHHDVHEVKRLIART